MVDREMTKQLHVITTILLCLVFSGCGDSKRNEDSLTTAESVVPTALAPSPEANRAGSEPASPDGQEVALPKESKGLVLHKVRGAAVKGPLLYAAVTAYKIDPNAADLKGDVIAVGMTDQNANVQLGIPDHYMAQAPFLLEFLDGKELDGAIPAVPKLTTLVTRRQILDGIFVYATPVTDFVLRYAHHIADLTDSTTSIQPAGGNSLQGNGDGTINNTEFNAALDIASRHFKATLGAGVIAESLDFFTTSPILSLQSRQQDSLTYRSASEAFTALIVELQKASSSNGSKLDANIAIDALAMDLSDGVIDGYAGNEAIAPLQAIDDIVTIISTDPSQLTVPGTRTTIKDIDRILAAEASQIAPKVVVSPLQKPNLLPAVASLNPAPESAPSPVPEPISSPAPSPVPVPEPAPAPAPKPEPQPAPAPQPIEQPAPDTEPVAAPAPTTRSVTLKWNPPATRENGDYLSLGEIGGYEIYYAGELSGKEGKFSVNDGRASNYTISSLSPDIYHFSMSAIDSKDMKSKMSDVVEVDLR